MDYMKKKKKTYSYEHGGTHGTPSKADSLKSKISSALEGGATDAEIKEMIAKSGLAETHDIVYDNVEMTVSVTPKKDDRFGPKDAPGQRGDMFAMGGGTDKGKTAKELIREYQAILNRTGVSDEVRKMYEAKIADLRKSEKAMDGMRTYMHGGSHDDEMKTYKHGGSHRPETYPGQYMGRVMEDDGGKFANYDDGEGNMTKVYFMEDPGQVGEFVPDNDYLFEEVNGKMTARLAPGFEDQRNPRSRQIGKEVMEESTKGASKIENLLEKLMDEGRRGKDGTRTYRY